MRATRIAFAVVVLALLATPALAHVPEFPSDNDSPERAVAVPDAAKSWSFYDRLGSGETTYYRLTLEDDQRLRFGTFTPVSGEFTPSVVLMSTSLNESGPVPAGVSVPDGMGTITFDGERPDTARYEPFAPSTNYHTVSIDRRVEEGGEYLLAVYARDGSGPVGVTVGYEEEFSAMEYLTVPFDLVGIHLWEGQHPILVFGPVLGTLLGGGALVRARRQDRWDRPLRRYAVSGAALLILGTAAGTLVQMGLALSKTGPTAGAAVTTLFVAIPAVCGGWTLRVALHDHIVFTPRTRAGFALAGAASLATWAGFLIGPAVLLAVAVAPVSRPG